MSKKEWIKSYQDTVDTAEYIISKYARHDDISLDVGKEMNQTNEMNQVNQSNNDFAQFSYVSSMLAMEEDELDY